MTKTERRVEAMMAVVAEEVRTRNCGCVTTERCALDSRTPVMFPEDGVLGAKVALEQAFGYWGAK